MTQLTSQLRRTATGYAHWCPACKQMHVIPDCWTFNGNLSSPTFSPSVGIGGVQQPGFYGFQGEIARSADGKPVRFRCHYNLTAGVLHFYSDCTHAYRNRHMPLPALPEAFCDPLPDSSDKLP